MLFLIEVCRIKLLDFRIFGFVAGLVGSDMAAGFHFDLLNALSPEDVAKAFASKRRR